MNIIGSVKAHPYLAAGIAVVAVVGGSMLLGGSGGDGSGYSGDAVTAGTDLQNSQNQMAAALAGIQADLQKSMSATGATVELEKIRANSAFDIAQLSAGLGYAQIEAGKQVSTAQIMASEKGAAEETKRLQIDRTTSVEMQRLLTDTINNQTAATSRVALEAQKPHGVFSFLFG